jgi:hypothetical protein
MFYVRYTRPSHRGLEVNSRAAINPYLAPCGSSPVTMEHGATLPRRFSWSRIFDFRRRLTELLGASRYMTTNGSDHSST